MQITNQDIFEINRILNNFKQKKSKEDIFYNVCFCILIPQSKFKTVLKTVEWLKFFSFYTNDFTLEMLTDDANFKARFKQRKAIYLLQMKHNFDTIYNILISRMKPDDKRKWVKDNIKGLGWKTSSHLLRNLGYQNFAILDTHILKFMNKTKFDYLETEQEFRKLAKAQNLTPAQFDGIIWMKQAKVNEQQFIF